jgi:NADH-quinone oxidoreductase subunit M
MPKFSVLFFLITLGAIGVPGTSGFVGEFLVLMAAFKVNGVYCAVAALGMILGAVYMLWLYRRVFMGKLSPDLISHSTGAHKVSDVTTVELSVLSLLVVLLMGMGIYPKVVLTGINNTYAKIYPQLTK